MARNTPTYGEVAGPELVELSPEARASRAETRADAYFELESKRFQSRENRISTVLGVGVLFFLAVAIPVVGAIWKWALGL
jgi:hypothetical protein